MESVTRLSIPRIFHLLIPVLLSRIGKRTPLEVIHEIKFDCNLRCKYCGLPTTKIKDIANMIFSIKVQGIKPE